MIEYTEKNVCGSDNRQLELESVGAENLAQAFDKCSSFPEWTITRNFCFMSITF